MSDPLGDLFSQFVSERIYLHNVTAKTQVWYQTAWKAFRASQVAPAEGPTLTKQRLQDFVAWLRRRDVRPRSVNTYLQVLNAFGRWLNAEGHSAQRVGLALLRTEHRAISSAMVGK